MNVRALSRLGVRVRVGMNGIDSFFFRFGDQSNTDLLKQDEGIYQYKLGPPPHFVFIT